MTSLWREVRFIFRALAKTPGFTAAAVVILALGIGANTAVFSVFDRVILQLLPVRNPRELVLIEVDGPEPAGMAGSDNDSTVYSYPQYVDFCERNDVCSGIIARTSAPLVFASGAQVDRASGELVSGNFFEVLGIRAKRGRLFTEADDRQEGAHPVAVISHGFWRRHFGASEDVIGQDITLNGVPMVIIGVAPEEFFGVMTGHTPDIYVTLAMRKRIQPTVYATDRLPERMVRSFNVLARLKPSVTFAQASATMQGAWRQIVEAELEQLGTRLWNKQEYRARSLRLTPALQGIHELRHLVEKPLFSVTALAVLVLLITCVNMAGLLMTRARARRHGIAIRIALGASKRNVVMRVLLESLTLGVLGGAAGLLVAFATTKLLAVLTAVGELNARVLLFNFVLAALTALLFGLAPAWQAMRTPVSAALKERSSGTGSARDHARFRRGAVVVQIALSTLLLVAAGLFTKTLYNLRTLDPGFRTENLLSFNLDPALNGCESERSRLLYERTLAKLQQLPGVRAVGAAAVPVLGHSAWITNLRVERYEAGDGEEPDTSVNVVSHGYFDTMGIPLVLGRRFNERDRAGAPRVAIVNEAFVSQYCAGENPLGRRMATGSHKDSLDIEIVGVVKNQKSADLREPLACFVYTPYTQEDDVPSLTFYLWCERDEAALGPEVRRVVRGLDAHLPVSRLQTVGARREEVLRPERTIALLACGFAGIAAVLAATGLYGLLAYGVVQRMREIGIRMALGARRAHIFALVFREALVCFGLGLALGLPLALGLGRYLEAQLYGLKANDPLVVFASTVVLGLAACIAATVPSRKAARTDPMEALRYE